ncbi:hypothetical protein AAC387_Pa06g0904 [Persea americana]
MFSERCFHVHVLFLALCCLSMLGFGATQPPQEEVMLFQKIAEELGRPDWNNVNNPCVNTSFGTTQSNDVNLSINITCNCSVANDSFCHITSIILTGLSLPGVLPPELANLPYLEIIDLTRNYLSGTIPPEWGSSKQLTKIALTGNRLSGKIPKEIGDITTLQELFLEANQLSGEIPPQLGNLTNLKTLVLSSNNFSGALPDSISKLNLKDFKISDNKFTGKIPDFIGNWTQLETVIMYASGLDGPIPPGIFSLKNLSDLRISDIAGTGSAFPQDGNMTEIEVLVLRNCNLSGQIPAYVGKTGTHLDLSFNNLSGEIEHDLPAATNPTYMFLTHNLLRGSVPTWMLQKKTKYYDLSYNNFTLEGSMLNDCRQNSVNLFQSSSAGKNLSGVIPCLKKQTTCQETHYHLGINCGGDKFSTYQTDKENSAVANYFNGDNWGVSSTGDFMDNGDKHYVITADDTKFPNLSPLYKTARLSPLSLTYYGFCLHNGNYHVKLHFAEIIITDDATYSSLGRRIFDIYIQGDLKLKDFNIKDEAKGSGKEIVKEFSTNVANNTLEIHFYWGGKGTKDIPEEGTYGPLISAISVDYIRKGKISKGVVIAIVASVVCPIVLVLGILWRKGFLGGKTSSSQDLRDLDLQTGSFTLRQIKAATNNFHISNKIGEGGFGSVYKGQLSDGTIIAVKQLSSKSKQGNREFITEMGMISALRHPNLVKLYGCCIEGNQLSLVYEYMQNNSLARVLFGPEDYPLQLDWPTRHKICVGIARGLAYLHEESILKIVHRDIKATNVLLDKDLNPKISDFGLAKLDEEEDTHISTRIAGTIGYMAPEYAMHGYLTDKADVYSFGVVGLEIVSGKSITKYRPKGDHIHLIDWAYVQQERGNLMDLVDPRLGSDFNKEEAMLMINVSLLCTNASPTLRPIMSAVVSMLEGHTIVRVPISDPHIPTDSLNIMSTGYCVQEEESLSQSLIASMDQQFTASSASGADLYPTNLDSEYWNKRE